MDYSGVLEWLLPPNYMGNVDLLLQQGDHYREQGSAHTGQWWSGPTTTQKILPPLSFENSFFYYHLVFTIVFLPPFSLKNVQTDQILTTTQSSLGRTLR